MILIADSGSTKTAWTALLEDSGSVSFRTQGYNPNYMTSEEILDDLGDSFPEDLDPMAVSEVYFYGAGVNDVTSAVVRSALMAAFPGAGTMVVESDLLGSAKALLGDQPGFAAILGTGMNSCVYDGRKIVRNVGSLGFLLGDEGSAGYIGKCLLRDYLRGNVPPGVSAGVSGLLEGKSYAETVALIYSQPKPNTYCASFCRYVTDSAFSDGADSASKTYCRDLLKESFRTFFRNVVCLYPGWRDCTFNCVGSVAYVCRDLLAEVASEFEIQMGRILQEPMDGLVNMARTYRL